MILQASSVQLSKTALAKSLQTEQKENKYTNSFYESNVTLKSKLATNRTKNENEKLISVINREAKDPN